MPKAAGMLNDELAQLDVLRTLTQVLTGHNSFEACLDTLADELVPEYVDGFSLLECTPDRSLKLLAINHVDRRKVAWVRKLGSQPLQVEWDGAIGQALMTGQARLWSRMTPAELGEWSSLPAISNFIQNLGVKSAIIVPLRCNEIVVGMGFWVQTEAGRALQSADLALCEILGGMIACRMERRDGERENARRVAQMTANELKNPLATALANLEMAERLALSELSGHAIQPLLARARRSAIQLSATVNRLLETLDLLNGRLRFDAEPVEIPSLLQETLAPLSPSDRERIRLELAPGCATTVVRVDCERTVRALRSILENALQYSNPAQPIDIGLDNARGGCRVRVFDRGKGISPEECEHIEEPFFRGREAQSRNPEGLGLGLFYAGQVIRGQGGRFVVRSSHHGTEVSVSLPVES